MGKKVRAYELRGKKKDELEKELQGLKQELYQLNISKVTGSSSTNLLNIKELRKGIARIYTVMNETVRNGVKQKLTKKPHLLPLDLRTKGTRAWRRRLLPKHLAQKLKKTVVKSLNFPQRKFALRN